MKKYFISAMLLIFFSFSAFSQQTSVTAPKYKIDTVTKKITYTEIVNQQGTKDTLYNRAIHWCGIYFKKLDPVTIMDKPNGKASGSYKFRIFDNRNKDSIPIEMGTVLFNFSFGFKDNMYKYTLTDFTLKGSNPVFNIERWLDKKDKVYKSEWDYYFTQLDKNVKEFIKSLKKGMQEAVKVKDDW